MSDVERGGGGGAPTHGLDFIFNLKFQEVFRLKSGSFLSTPTLSGGGT
jgi:hypothetical protein